MKIDNRQIGYSQSPFLSCELGVNHQNDLPTALKMIDECAKAGVDGVKIQYLRVKDFCTDKDKTIEYKQRKPEPYDPALGINILDDITENYIEFFQRYEISLDFVKSCYDHTKQYHSFDRPFLFGITTTSEQGACECYGLCDYYKVASDMIKNMPMIFRMRETGIPIILSTGHIGNLHNLEAYARKEKDLVLHCVSDYPAKNARLWRIKHLQEMGYLTGYSDHTIGNEACIRAAELGAVFLEVHITLDKTLSGPDHWFSKDMSDLKQLVEAIK